MIIDMHTHIINEKVYQEYKEKIGNKISKMITLQSWEENPAELREFIQSKEDLFLVGYFDIEGNQRKQFVEIENLLKEKKICGVKIYPGYKHFHSNDKRIHKIAELCEKYSKPLMVHQGDVNDPEGNSRLKFAHPIFVDELASGYPNCKIVIAHFGFPYFLETATIANKNKNVYIDLSGTIDNCGSKKEIKKLRKQYEKDIRRAVIYYPLIKKRLLFGTDYGGEDSALNQINPYIKVVKNIFNKKERADIFYNTAQKLFFE